MDLSSSYNEGHKYIIIDTNLNLRLRTIYFFVAIPAWWTYRDDIS